MRVPARITHVAAATTTALLVFATSARAVLITQHTIPGESTATTIFSGPQGLYTSDGMGSYQTVTPSTFAVTPGPAGQAARSFFVGPDGGAWFIGGALVKVGEKQEPVATVNEITSGGPVTQFTYATGVSNPPWAVTGPDGGIWLVESPASALDHLSGGTLTSVPLAFGNAGPVQVISADGDLWTTNMVDGKIARVTPEGVVTEYLPDGPSFGSFANTEPFGLVAGPDGAVWFAQQNHASIGRITPAGEVSSVPITAPSRTGIVTSTIPQPRYLAVGPEGAIWFTDPGTNSIGRVAGGVATEYPIPGENGAVVPDVIATAGSELWFNERGTHAIGSVNPTAEVIEHPASPSPTLTKSQLTGAVTANTTIGALLKRGSYTASIPVTGAGTVAIIWKAATTTVATGHAALAATGLTKVAVRLTTAGRKLLKRSRKPVRITIRATLSVTRGETVTATGTKTLRR